MKVFGPSILRPKSLISFTSKRLGQAFGSSLLSIAGFSRTLSSGPWMSPRRPYNAFTWTPSSWVFVSWRSSQFTRAFAVLRSSGAPIVMLLASVFVFRSAQTLRADTPSGIRYSISSPWSLHSPSSTRFMNAMGSSRSPRLSFTGTGWCSSSVSCSPRSRVFWAQPAATSRAASLPLRTPAPAATASVTSFQHAGMRSNRMTPVLGWLRKRTKCSMSQRWSRSSISPQSVRSRHFVRWSSRTSAGG